MSRTERQSLPRTPRSGASYPMPARCHGRSIPQIEFPEQDRTFKIAWFQPNPNFASDSFFPLRSTRTLSHCWAWGGPNPISITLAKGTRYAQLNILTSNSTAWPVSPNGLCVNTDIHLSTFEKRQRQTQGTLSLVKRDFSVQMRRFHPRDFSTSLGKPPALPRRTRIQQAQCQTRQRTLPLISSSC